MAKGKREIEVEIKQNGHKTEIEIEEHDGKAEVEIERDGDELEVVTAGELEKKRSGAGFLLGALLGTIAGAAAAFLFAPPGDEETQRAALGPPDTMPEALDDGSLLGTIRSRIAVARSEAREASREAEARTRARYDELTRE